jgi:hypothetical protein
MNLDEDPPATGAAWATRAAVERIEDGAVLGLRAGMPEGWHRPRGDLPADDLELIAIGPVRDISPGRRPGSRRGHE